MKYLLKYDALFESITNEDIIKKASIFSSILDLKRNNLKLYNLVINNHLENTIFPKKIKWTSEKIKEEAKKFKTKGEFSKKSNGAYNRAAGLGMLDELFPKEKSD